MVIHALEKFQATSSSCAHCSIYEVAHVFTILLYVGK